MTVARTKPTLVRTVSDLALTLAGFGAGALIELGRQPGRVVAQLSTPLRVVVRGAVTVVLDQLDLTELVIERVDLDRIAQQLDIEAIIRRLDMAGIAHEVLTEIDLPEIIRESSASLVADGVRDARMRSIMADRLVSTWVRRMLRQDNADATPAQRPDPTVSDDR